MGRTAGGAIEMIAGGECGNVSGATTFTNLPRAANAGDHKCRMIPFI